MTMRRLKENSADDSTFSAVAPDALALSIAGVISSGTLAVKTSRHFAAVRETGSFRTEADMAFMSTRPSLRSDLTA